MKGRQLRKAVLLGMALSMVVWTTGMAENITGPITDGSYNRSEDNPYTESVTVTNTDADKSAIQINGETVNITTGSGEETGYDITLDSKGSGIRTEGGDDTSSVSLNSSADNIINFGNGGNGIFSESGMGITLNAVGNNTITSDVGDGNGGDGINATGSGKITLTAGGSNIINVISDGIHTEAGSSNDKEFIAETGNNEITTGNNGIDHEGDGNVILTANNGSNIIHAGEGQTAMEGDGIRVAGDGGVTLNAKYNEITGHDEGIYTDVANSNVSITATKVDENGIGNYIQGADNGIEVVGRKTDSSGKEVATGVSTVTITAQEGANKVVAGQAGIKVNGTGNSIILEGNTNIIDVTGATSSDDFDSTNSARKRVYGINAVENGAVEIKSIDDADASVSTITLDDVHGAVSGIHAASGGMVKVEQNALKIDIHRLNGTHEGNTEEQAKEVYGIAVNTDGLDKQIGNSEDSAVSITTTKDLSVKVQSDADTKTAAGVYASNNGQVDLTSKEGALHIDVDTVSPDASGSTSGIESVTFSKVTATTKNGIDIDVTDTSEATQSVYGVRVNVSNKVAPTEMLDAGTVVLNTEGDLTVDVQAGVNSSGSGLSATSYTNAPTGGEIRVEQANNVIVNISGKSVNALNGGSSGKTIVNAINDVSLNANTLEGSTGGYARGIYSFNGQDMVTAGGNININAQGFGTKNTVQGIYSFGNNSNDGVAELTGAAISITAQTEDGTAYGINAEGSGNSTVSLTAKTGDNTITSSGIGVATGAGGGSKTKVALTSEHKDNVIYAGDLLGITYGDGAEANIFGNAEAIQSQDGSIVALQAANENNLSGAVSASGAGTSVTVNGLEGAAAKTNEVYSAAAIANAGGLSSDPAFAGKEVISSLYGEHGAQISVSGDQNVIRTYADNTNENQLERTVWAYETADITIDGQTTISTDRYETSPNSLDIAVAAGTATDLTEDKVNAPVADRAMVNINYDSYTDADGNTVQSSITGDILSAYAGEVNITPKSDTAQMHITGNILAGNNGVLNVNLGNGGTLTGRADDYGDAGVITDSEHTTFFDPAFSSAIYKGGEVNLTMGDNSRWNVTGQSWITTVDTTGSSNALIDLVSANTDRNSSAHALTIYDMKGDATFNMSLDADRSVSDMVYMKHADGSYLVNVIDPVT